MSVELLDKTRKINQLLRDNRVSKVAFTDLCRLLGELLESSVYVISNKGKILGINQMPDDTPHSFFPSSEGQYMDAKMAKRFLEVLSTKENVNLEFMGFPREVSEEIQAMIAPVYIAGKRLGTLFLARRTRCYGIEDIILTEYSTTVVGLEMMRAVSEEDDFASRKKQEIESILHILSPLEKSAVKQVIQRIEQGEGTIVTSRLAKEVGITRTVIVNALKKVEFSMVLSNAYNYVNVLGKAADASWTRNDILANNIANADTPGFKRKDVQFETYLKNAVAGTDSLNETVANIDLNELNCTTYTDQANLSYRYDGNNVDINTENVELAKNQLKYYTLMNSMSQEFSRLKSALRTS